jgi:hypothetical protein
MHRVCGTPRQAENVETLLVGLRYTSTPLTDAAQKSAVSPSLFERHKRAETWLTDLADELLRKDQFLKRQDHRFLIVEASDSVGAAWRTRWDALVLFTPRRYDSLPGLTFPGDPDGYPTRDEVIAYLDRYATTFELPVELVSSGDRWERAHDSRCQRVETRRALLAPFPRRL